MDAMSTVVVAKKKKNDYDNRYNNIIIVLGSFAKNTAVDLYDTLDECIRKPMYTSELKVMHIITVTIGIS